MSTGEKERRVINRAVRVLDEIESRIHELREELEQGGVSTGRGRKSQRDEHHDDAEGDNDREPHAQGRVKHPETDKRVKGNKAEHDAATNGDEHHAADDEHEPHAQGRVKHPETDKRLKANRPGHEDGDDETPAAHSKPADAEHEPHAQGKVKHPESDKRVKGNHGAGDELHGAAKDAHEAKAGGNGAKAEHEADDDREPHAQGRVKHPETDKRVKANKD